MSHLDVIPPILTKEGDERGQYRSGQKCVNMSPIFCKQLNWRSAAQIITRLYNNALQTRLSHRKAFLKSHSSGGRKKFRL